MEIYRADPQLRRLVAVLLVVAAAVGAIIYWFFRHWLMGLSQLPSLAAGSRLALAFGWCLGLACLSLAVFAVYLWRLGAKVVGCGQFPVPGARLLRDTTILRGGPARRRGRWLQGLGAVLFACAIGLAVVAWRLYLVPASGMV